MKPLAKKYIVCLNADERKELETMVKKGEAAAYKRLHAEDARIKLKRLYPSIEC